MLAKWSLFRCRDCGADELVVEHRYDLIHTYSVSIPCTCEGEHGTASFSRRTFRVPWREWGPLGEDHHWSYEDNEEGEKGEEDELEFEAACFPCSVVAGDGEAEIATEETQVDEESHEFFVFCGGCGREIEFGWSHPDRGGRIWPAEANDFNPWKSWPEPRFVDSWREKNWLRPGSQQAA
jgi:hypothetical protein